MICRYCKQPIVGAAAPTHSYWSAVPFVSHPACRVAGYKAEAYECQLIDSDCNDCRFFTRDEMISKEIWQGRCLNDARHPRPHARIEGDRVWAFPNFASDHPCFVHRRTPA